MKRLLAIMLCAAMVTTGCASASGPRVPVAAVTPAGTAAIADYVQRLPAGSRVRVDRSDGTLLKGTLLKATADGIVIQTNTRVPEPPIDVPMSQVARVTLEGANSSTGRAIGIGVAAGLGAFFGILAIIAAAMD
jgi:hypothetical protein